MNNPPKASDVDFALKRLGAYRVKRAQEVANEGVTDGIDGGHVLALGLRETWGRNVEGGAKLIDGRWVPEDDPKRMDVGMFQISRRYHPDALKLMPGVKVGTWGPVVEGKSANVGGFVPQFTTGLRFTIEEMRDAIAFAEDHGVPDGGGAQVRFAIAAHNAGVGGALNGFKAGDVDKFTAGGDYSAWVLAAKKLVTAWLKAHPNWKIPK